MAGFRLTQLANGWTVGQFAALDHATNVAHVVATGAGLDVQLAKSDRGQAARQVAAAMGLPHRAYCDQVHGTTVHCVSGGGPAGKGDALATSTAGVALCAFSADCPLILVADSHGRAVGVAHASWRATVGLIAVKLVARMNESLGVRPGDLIACIAPAPARAATRLGQMSCGRPPEASARRPASSSPAAAARPISTSGPPTWTNSSKRVWNAPALTWPASVRSAARTYSQASAGRARPPADSSRPSG